MGRPIRPMRLPAIDTAPPTLPGVNVREHPGKVDDGASSDAHKIEVAQPQEQYEQVNSEMPTNTEQNLMRRLPGISLQEARAALAKAQGHGGDAYKLLLSEHGNATTAGPGLALEQSPGGGGGPNNVSQQPQQAEGGSDLPAQPELPECSKLLEGTRCQVCCRLMCIPICCPIVSGWYVYMWCMYFCERFIAPCCECIYAAIEACCSAVFKAILDPLGKATGACCLWIYKNIATPVCLVIGTCCTWLWENVLTPICVAIGACCTWFYENVGKPICMAIGACLSWMHENIVVPVCQAIRACCTWLCETVVKPVFAAIAACCSWLCEKLVKPFCSALFSVVAAIFRWIYEAILAPIGGIIGHLLGVNGRGDP